MTKISHLWFAFTLKMKIDPLEIILIFKRNSNSLLSLDYLLKNDIK